MTETMTDNLPAVWGRLDLDELARLGKWLATSEGSDLKEAAGAKGSTAALRLYYAYALGLPPLAAADMPVIKGKVSVGANVLRALAGREGYIIERVESSDTSCTAAIHKGGRELGRETFTIDDAKRAGLIRPGTPWTTYPARMLWARASKYLIMDFAPQVALGLVLDDEVPEMLGQTSPMPLDATLDADADVEATLLSEEDIPWDIPWPDPEAPDPED